MVIFFEITNIIVKKVYNVPHICNHLYKDSGYTFFLRVNNLLPDFSLLMQKK